MQAERAILGCCLLDKAALIAVLRMIAEEDFFHQGHRHVFRAVSDLEARGTSVDYVTLTSHMLMSGHLEAAGGAEYLAGLTSTVASVRNAEHYSRVVAELSRLRKLASFGREISAFVEQGKTDSAELVEWTMGRMIEMGRRSLDGRTAQDIDESILEADRRAAELARPSSRGILSLGFPRLDRVVTMLPGDMFVLAGRPSVGKTGMAVSMTLNVCRREGRVLFISAEMDRQQMAHRFVGAVADIPLDLLRRGVVQNLAGNSRVQALMALRSAIRVIFAPGLTDQDVARMAKQELLEGNRLDLVIVDYLHRMKYAGRPQDRRIGIGNIANNLKDLAGELRLPVLVLSQLARPTGQDKTRNRPPSIFDLKEAGEIENAADVVGLLHRLDTDKTMPEWRVDLMIEKNRNGPLGDIPFIMTRKTATFREADGPPRARGGEDE